MEANNPFQQWSHSSGCCSATYGCAKQLISQTGEKVKMVDLEEENEGKEAHWQQLV